MVEAEHCFAQSILGLAPWPITRKALLAIANRRAAKKDGQAFVELSLVLAAVGGMFFIAFDFARLLILYLLVVNAARDGGRVAALTGTQDPIAAAIPNSALSLQPVGGSVISVTCHKATSLNASPWFTDSGVDCPTSAPGRVAPDAFVVTVATTFQPIVPFIGFAAGKINNGQPIAVSYSIFGIVGEAPS